MGPGFAEGIPVVGFFVALCVVCALIGGGIVGLVWWLV
jgi:hypothetical protein